MKPLSSRQRRLSLSAETLRLLTAESFTWHSQIHVLTARERREVLCELTALCAQTERLNAALLDALDDAPMVFHRERNAA